MKKLIPVAFFALLALNTNVINAANTSNTIKVADQPIENRLSDKESSKLNKETDKASTDENLVSVDSSSKMYDSSALNSSDNAGIYISSGAALIIIVILLIILL